MTHSGSEPLPGGSTPRGRTPHPSQACLFCLMLLSNKDGTWLPGLDSQVDHSLGTGDPGPGSHLRRGGCLPGMGWGRHPGWLPAAWSEARQKLLSCEQSDDQGTVLQGNQGFMTLHQIGGSSGDPELLSDSVRLSVVSDSL